MPGPVAPYTAADFENGVDVADGAKVYALARALYDYFGSIVAADLSPAAAIPGSYLSNIAGQRVPDDRIEDDAVTAAKLRDSATVDGDRAVTTDHVRDLAVTLAKLAAASVSGAKLKIGSIALTVSLPGTILTPLGNQAITTGKTTAQIVPLFIAVERAGAAQAPDGVVEAKLFLNTATSTYFILVGNPTSVNQDTANLTFRLTYLDMT